MDFKQLLKRKVRTEVVGLAIDNNSIALSVLLPDSEMKFKHTLSVYRSLENPNDAAATLQSIVKDNSLQRCHCHWVLASHQYKIHQIDLPEANQAEMLPAVTWAVKDLLDYPVTQVIIDYYEVPQECVRGSQQKINVVCANKEELQPSFDAIKAAGLITKVIDIPELALRNIMQTVDHNQHGVGLMYQIPEGVILGIYREQKLLFSRVLTGINNLQDAMDQVNGLVTKENILLETQRTIDYYESQLSQPPLGAIYIQPLIVDPGTLKDYLASNLNPKIEMMDLNKLVLTLKEFTAPIQYGCIKSLSVAMRDSEAA